ncbi:MAG: radical SAM protein [Methanomassiliicoccales archaeon]
MSLRSWWAEVLGRGLHPGVYKYDGNGDLAHHRFHLRVDSELKGVLLIDASKLVFLNGTAVDYVRCVLENRSEGATTRYMRRRYKNLEKKVAAKHFQDFKGQLREFLRGHLEVLNQIGSDKPSIGADDFPAHYRMDLALTYRCQNTCGHCYLEHKDKKELAVEDWKNVITKLWGLGIPHVVFTGGEATLYEGIEELVSKSEEFGQVTGLITNGRNLRKEGYLHNLVGKGLDHVQITVLSFKESVHDRLVGSEGAWKETVEGLKIALREDLYVSTNTTIMRSNYEDIEDTMRHLIAIGVKNIAVNSIIRSGKGEETEGISYDELRSVLTKLKAIADENGINLIWYSPTPYCEFNPINYGLGIKQCTACSLNMAIEPDGTVLPCQSYYEPLGNILTDPWDRIWNHELCKKIRGRKYLDGECTDCQLSDICGGGCPLARTHGDYICLDRHSSV